MVARLAAGRVTHMYFRFSRIMACGETESTNSSRIEAEPCVLYTVHCLHKAMPSERLWRPPPPHAT